MHYMIDFNSFTEFTQAIITRDIRLVKNVTDKVIEAIQTNKQHITLFSTPDISGDEILSYTLYKDQYGVLLKRSLIDFEENEMYEDCIRVREMLKKCN
jgi:hypothetical protein